MAETRTIKVEALARVEGEGSLSVKIKDGKVKELHCGICPIAYLMGASQAMEDALGITVTRPIRDLRRLIYCGEWIESHALHVYMLHAPDFLGLADALELAKVNRPLVENALRLKKIGNDILETIGGRAIHPVGLRVGGFYKAPSRKAIRALEEDLKWAVETSIATVKLVGGFEFPDVEQDYNFMALRHPDEYAIHEGRLVTSAGLDIPVSQFLDHVDEEHVPWSNALHGVAKDGSAHHVGPLARYNLNYDKLSDTARAAAKDAGLGPVVRNPFKSIVVRAVELVQVCEDALKLVQGYVEPDKPFVDAPVRAGEGHGCTEAPRGICYHRYKIDKDGAVLDARIIPPTAQNQKVIELDLAKVVEQNLANDDEAIKWRCEQAIRNYDPCISCATHFLKLDLDRG